MQFFTLLSLFFPLFVFAYQEALYLSEIRQVTFPSMGFEKAGESYFSPDGKSLIFQAVPQGQKEYQIYTIDLETEEFRMISTGFGACTCGFYRPDGKKILFASSHESPLALEYEEPSTRYRWHFTPYMNLYEAELDGSDLQRLTSGSAYHAECAYSPDGERIVYASNETGNMNLYVCNSDGKEAHAITYALEGYHGGPFFSPDGKWVVFRADKERRDYLQIYLIRPDGSEEKPLTADEYVNWAPFWHPNGQAIVYTTSQHGHGAYQIYLLHIETKKRERITYSDTFEGLASFNKEGTQMTWTSKRGDGTSQVFIANFSYPEGF